MIGAITQLGDEIGTYIGITGILKKPVKVDLWKPSRVHRPPNVIMIGPQGGGKSFAADPFSIENRKKRSQSSHNRPKRRPLEMGARFIYF
ncbi:hypothetical protein L21TH_2344 [Caldisalinibacter kiritimatiensis]|uniref:Uncharacterized protein n=1 Tax=Caldisalinibacter kiritimatiensis TaxID=1304284 RepID=R1CBE0_9FIRM|nr:hypothetical protein L21TH_2344 [Caldisalinibacter kiritimatiensis]